MTRRKKAADALCQLRSQQCPTVGAGVPDGPAATARLSQTSGEFAERGSLPLALLLGRRDAAPYNKMLRIRPKAFAWEESAVVNENRPH